MGSLDARAFLKEYVEAAAADLDDALAKYVRDPSLVEHAHFFQSGFPGYTIEPIEVVAEGNKIAVYAIFHGVHRGPIMGIEPTGKEVSSPFMIMYFIEDAKIVKHHIVLNELSVLRQLGAVPAGTPA